MDQAAARDADEPDALRHGRALADAALTAAELNHRMANSLQMAVNLLGFEQQRATDPAARQALESAMARLAAVGELHHYLGRQDPQASVALEAFLAGLCAQIDRTTGLRCELRTEAIRVRGEQAQQIGLLINECAINARKHAYGGEGGVLCVECSATDGGLRIVVSDEGPGFPAPIAHARRGLGMTIIEALVRELGGAFTVETCGGARLGFLLPPAVGVGPASRSFAPWDEA